MLGTGFDTYAFLNPVLVNGVYGTWMDKLGSALKIIVKYEYEKLDVGT